MNYINLFWDFWANEKTKIWALELKNRALLPVNWSKLSQEGHDNCHEILLLKLSKGMSKQGKAKNKGKIEKETPKDCAAKWPGEGGGTE